MRNEDEQGRTSNTKSSLRRKHNFPTSSGPGGILPTDSKVTGTAWTCRGRTHREARVSKLC